MVFEDRNNPVSGSIVAACVAVEFDMIASLFSPGYRPGQRRGDIGECQ